MFKEILNGDDAPTVKPDIKYITHDQILNLGPCEKCEVKGCYSPYPYQGPYILCVKCGFMVKGVEILMVSEK